MMTLSATEFLADACSMFFHGGDFAAACAPEYLLENDKAAAQPGVCGDEAPSGNVFALHN
ncbi:MAG: hypothetical protein JOZ62_00260 [Acidobacteriaceae bacterium]|nr:hypothetical protein [Acidobacteriaceae bacterium]